MNLFCGDRFRQSALDTSMKPEYIRLTLGDQLVVWSGSIIQYGIGKKDEVCRTGIAGRVVGTWVEYWLDENPTVEASLCDLRDEAINFPLCDYFHPDFMEIDDFLPTYTRDPSPIDLSQLDALFPPDQPIPSDFDDPRPPSDEDVEDNEDEDAEEADLEDEEDEGEEEEEEN